MVIIILKINRNISNQEENPQTRKLKQGLLTPQRHRGKRLQEYRLGSVNFTAQHWATDKCRFTGRLWVFQARKICSHNLLFSLLTSVLLTSEANGTGPTHPSCPHQDHTDTHLPAPGSGGATGSTQKNTGLESDLCFSCSHVTD